MTSRLFCNIHFNLAFTVASHYISTIMPAIVLINVKFINSGLDRKTEGTSLCEEASSCCTCCACCTQTGGVERRLST